jgi:hypothetical protein
VLPLARPSSAFHVLGSLYQWTTCSFRNVAIDEGFEVDSPCSAYCNVGACLFLPDLSYPFVNVGEALRLEVVRPIGLKAAKVALRGVLGLQRPFGVPLFDSGNGKVAGCQWRCSVLSGYKYASKT